MIRLGGPLHIGETKFTIDYFISKFSEIPEEEFKVPASFGSEGLLNLCKTGEALVLYKLFPPVGSIGIIYIGNHSRYPQPTPKLRILAALKDAITQ